MHAHVVLFSSLCCFPFLPFSLSLLTLCFLSPLRFILGDKPASVTADVYAQCQVVLLTLGLPECLLYVWQLENTSVFTVKKNSDWCALMLKVCSRLMISM